ncbi:MAG TPA: IS1595 family transposase [Methylomirabilota bacterium]|nr:IS1595 family transposase [Methylomirabilota bacterium]
MSVLNASHFHDEQAAYDFVEARVWPQGRVCPHCGTVDHSGKLAGKSTRVGVYKCYDCRKPFTVKVGTIFESSHIALHIWLQAMFLLCSSKKGISSNQLHRALGVTLKTAWFLSHRIREAMKEGAFPGQLGGAGVPVEADETFIGRKKGKEIRRGSAHKHAVVSLVERGARVRSFHVQNVNRHTIDKVLTEQVHPASRLMTDEAHYYKPTGKQFAAHESVNHSKDEYVRGEAHTNTVEGFFSVFKRGMIGIYQHCGEHHLRRYLAEYDFRYNNRQALGVNDTQRTEQALRGIVGRRLTYRTTNRQVRFYA